MRVGRRRTGEFVGLGAEETRRAVSAGWRVLKLAGVEPDGFVAPAYAYTPALRSVLPSRFRWWAGLLGVHRRAADSYGDDSRVVAPAWSLSSAGVLQRTLSPALVRAGAMLAGDTLRLDLHPSDLQHPRHMLALERVLARAAPQRTAITYDELLSA